MYDLVYLSWFDAWLLPLKCIFAKARFFYRLHSKILFFLFIVAFFHNGLHSRHSLPWLCLSRKLAPTSNAYQIALRGHAIDLTLACNHWIKIWFRRRFNFFKLFVRGVLLQRRQPLLQDLVILHHGVITVLGTGHGRIVPLVAVNVAGYIAGRTGLLIIDGTTLILLIWRFLHLICNVAILRHFCNSGLFPTNELCRIQVCGWDFCSSEIAWRFIWRPRHTERLAVYWII